MRKKIGLIIGFVLLLGLVWYIFLKPYDYLVKFKINTPPENVDQSIKLWAKTLQNSEILESNSPNALTQRLRFGDSVHVYNWSVRALNDSTSQIKVYAVDTEHTLQNKMRIPFASTNFEKRTKKTLSSFVKIMNDHLKDFKISIVGETVFRNNFCAYVTVNSTQLEKAQGMNANLNTLDHFLTTSGAMRNGPPFLEVISWNRENDSITYNFCYPIKEMDSIPKKLNIKFKRFSDKKAIKAIYNGNYITSDRAWYALLAYARKNDLLVSENPIEVFYDNPSVGTNELEWKAEIFMPLKSSHE